MCSFKVNQVTVVFLALYAELYVSSTQLLYPYSSFCSPTPSQIHFKFNSYIIKQMCVCFFHRILDLLYNVWLEQTCNRSDENKRSQQQFH